MEQWDTKVHEDSLTEKGEDKKYPQKCFDLMEETLFWLKEPFFSAKCDEGCGHRWRWKGRDMKYVTRKDDREHFMECGREQKTGPSG